MTLRTNFDEGALLLSDNRADYVYSKLRLCHLLNLSYS